MFEYRFNYNKSDSELWNKYINQISEFLFQ